MRITLEQIDICTPDYFLGSKEPYLGVPVYKDMTWSGLQNSLWHAAQSTDFGYLDDGITEDAFYSALETAIGDLRQGSKDKCPFWKSGIGTLKSQEGQDVLPYCYIRIVIEE